MPTIFSHPAVAFGVAPWFRRLPARLIVIAAVCSSLPDIDVTSFAIGIPYEHPLGHRGATHSIVFALMLAAFVSWGYVRLTRNAVPFARCFAFLFIAIASHGLLDAMTTGGRGVGFFIPFSSERYFFPFRPIVVSPIGAADFVPAARAVLASELRWVWLPAVALGALGLLAGLTYHRRLFSQPRQEK